MCHSTLQKVADPKKNISMHKILFFGKEPPIKKKEVVQFRVGEEKDVGTREDVSFQNTGTKIYTCLILDANCYCYFPLFIYKCRPQFGIYLHMPFLSFLLVQLVRMVRVCSISF